jgi:hypothetical protein
MQSRTFSIPLQMVQYFSQVQRSSGKSHCAQSVGPSMSASWKTVPEQEQRRQGEAGRRSSSRVPAPFRRRIAWLQGVCEFSIMHEVSPLMLMLDSSIG